MKRRTMRSQPRNPPMAASLANCGVTSDSGEEKFAAMNPSNSSRYSSVSQARSRW